MRKHILNITLLSSLLVGCDDVKFGNAFLDKPLSDDKNINDVYADKKYAEQALNQVYHSLPDFQSHNNRLGWGILEGITDLADMTKSGGTGYHKGTVSASKAAEGVYSMSYNTEHGEFSATYGIRQAHLFLENVDRVPNMTEEEKNIRKGEAMMIIAYHYMNIFRNLGGMPWIDHAYKPDDDMHMTRMTLEESVENICKLIDDAAALLPWETSAADAGRMTKGGALALKSRLLTFAASPLFNDDQPYKEGEAAEKHYVWFGGKSQERWNDALKAGLDFMRENQRNGEAYQLVNTGNPRKDFYEGFFERFNHEVLISSHRYEKWDINCKPLKQVSYGAALPTLNYADMFDMKDGTPFSWDNPEHRAHPFFDADGNEVRDPRLYETLIVTGDKFWNDHKRGAEICEGGREVTQDMRQDKPDWRWGNMGYFGIAPRKLWQDHKDNLGGKFYQCPLMRLPEVYLNIAEAMNELGKAEVKDEFGRNAYDYVNLVRGRVEMPKLTPEQAAPGVALREAILKERALEFGYEEVRHYDIMRWKHNDYLKNLKIRRLKTWLNEGEEFAKITDLKKHVFRYEIVEETINKRVWVENWDNRYYLCPIPLDEINKRYGLIQNPGWE